MWQDRVGLISILVISEPVGLLWRETLGDGDGGSLACRGLRRRLPTRRGVSGESIRLVDFLGVSKKKLIQTMRPEWLAVYSIRF